MATKITSSSPTQNVPKLLLMPHKLLKAAIDGNETDLRQLLGLNDEDDHPLHTNISVEDVTPLEPSDCLRKATGNFFFLPKQEYIDYQAWPLVLDYWSFFFFRAKKIKIEISEAMELCIAHNGLYYRSVSPFLKYKQSI